MVTGPGQPYDHRKVISARQASGLAYSPLSTKPLQQSTTRCDVPTSWASLPTASPKPVTARRSAPQVQVSFRGIGQRDLAAAQRFSSRIRRQRHRLSCPATAANELCAGGQNCVEVPRWVQAVKNRRPSKGSPSNWVQAMSGPTAWFEAGAGRGCRISPPPCSLRGAIRGEAIHSDHSPFLVHTETGGLKRSGAIRLEGPQT